VKACGSVVGYHYHLLLFPSPLFAHMWNWCSTRGSDFYRSWKQTR
jgi:hypothetical protein